MISRFFTWGLLIGLFVLLIWKISDITPKLSRATQIINRKSQTITITPVLITASRRDYPSVVENRGKGFIIHKQTGTIYSARHVINDNNYNYYVQNMMLLVRHHLSGDVAYTQFSGFITGTVLNYQTGLLDNQVLVGQYRHNQRNWLTGTILQSGFQWIAIDISVVEGDSGSPVIFADKTLGIISQSHNSNEAIIEKIKR